MKKSIIIGSLIIAALFLSGCGRNLPETTQNNTTTEATESIMTDHTLGFQVIDGVAQEPISNAEILIGIRTPIIPRLENNKEDNGMLKVVATSKEKNIKKMTDEAGNARVSNIELAELVADYITGDCELSDLKISVEGYQDYSGDGNYGEDYIFDTEQQIQRYVCHRLFLEQDEEITIKLLKDGFVKDFLAADKLAMRSKIFEDWGKKASKRYFGHPDKSIYADIVYGKFESPFWRIGYTSSSASGDYLLGCMDTETNYYVVDKKIRKHEEIRSIENPFSLKNLKEVRENLSDSDKEELVNIMGKQDCGLALKVDIRSGEVLLDDTAVKISKIKELLDNCDDIQSRINMATAPRCYFEAFKNNGWTKEDVLKYLKEKGGLWADIEHMIMDLDSPWGEAWLEYYVNNKISGTITLPNVNKLGSLVIKLREFSTTETVKAQYLTGRNTQHTQHRRQG